VTAAHMNSKHVIAALMAMVALLVLAVFVMMSSQLSSEGISSAHDHDHVHNNHLPLPLTHSGGIVDPHNLRGRFKSYDLAHPDPAVESHVEDPIDKQQEMIKEKEQEQEEGVGVKEVSPKDYGSSEGGRENDRDKDKDKGGDDVLPSFLPPQVMAPPVMSGDESMSEHGHGHVEGNEVQHLSRQEEGKSSDVMSPTMSSHEHYLDKASLFGDVRHSNPLTSPPIPSPPTLVFPFHESFPLHTIQSGGEGRRIFELYTSYWKRRTPSSDDSPLAPQALLGVFHSALKHGKECDELVSPNPTTSTSRSYSSTMSSTSSSSKFQSNNRRSSSGSSGSSGNSKTSMLNSAGPVSSLERAAYWEVVSVKPPLFVEFSSSASSASLVVSLALPSTISLLFDSSVFHRTPENPRPANLPSCAEEIMPDKSNPPSNVIVSTYPLPSTFDYSSSSLFNVPLDCVQLISSIEAIFTSSSLLPFDVEEALGLALCRCNTTILPSKLPTSSFFSYWNDMKMLIAEAAASASRRHICDFQVNETGTLDSMDGGIPTFTATGVLYVHRSGVYSKPIGHFSEDDAMHLDLSPSSLNHLVSAIVSKKNGRGGNSAHKVAGALKMSRFPPHESSSALETFPTHHQLEHNLPSPQSSVNLGNSSGVHETFLSVSDGNATVIYTGRRRKLYTTSYSSSGGVSSSSTSTSNSHLTYPRTSFSYNSTSSSSSSSSTTSSSATPAIKPSIEVKKFFGTYGRPRQRHSTTVPKSHWVLPEENSVDIRINADMLNWIEMNELEQSETTLEDVPRDLPPKTNRFGTVSNIRGNSYGDGSGDLPPSARLHQKLLRDKEREQHFDRWMKMLRQEASRPDSQSGSILGHLFDHDSKSTSSFSNGLVYVFGR
jgi:hypothetical protein